MQKAIQIPCKTIAENAGKEGATVVAKLLEINDPNTGFNAATNEFTNLFEAGVIDPVKVVKRALHDASSVSSLMITTECMIVEKKDPNAPAATPNPAAAMGGMPGMY